jgi:hypothetical protein
VRRQDRRLADVIWQRAREVDQGFRQRLSAQSLATRRPSVPAALNPQRVRLVYDALMRDLEDPRGVLARRATVHDSVIVTRIQERLRSVLEPGSEPVPLPEWPSSSKEPPWPAFVYAVRHYSPKAAAVEILAWALSKKPSYITRLVGHRKQPLGL